MPRSVTYYESIISMVLSRQKVFCFVLFFVCFMFSRYKILTGNAPNQPIQVLEVQRDSLGKERER